MNVIHSICLVPILCKICEPLSSCSRRVCLRYLSHANSVFHSLRYAFVFHVQSTGCILRIICISFFLYFPIMITVNNCKHETYRYHLVHKWSCSYWTTSKAPVQHFKITLVAVDVESIINSSQLPCLSRQQQFLSMKTINIYSVIQYFKLTFTITLYC